MPSHDPYVPLDVLYSRPTIRLLRILRRSGWISPEELYAAIAIETGGEVDNGAYKVVSRAVQSGFVERAPARWTHYPEFRITEAGRRYLLDALRRYEAALSWAPKPRPTQYKRRAVVVA